MERRRISLGGWLQAAPAVSFDDDNVYLGEGSGQKVIPLADVVSLTRTSSALNNRYFWLLEYRNGQTTERIEFRANTTLWNRSFPSFHARLTEVNPAAVKSPYRWWQL